MTQEMLIVFFSQDDTERHFTYVLAACWEIVERKVKYFWNLQANGC